MLTELLMNVHHSPEELGTLHTKLLGAHKWEDSILAFIIFQCDLVIRTEVCVPALFVNN